jgi:hypothetical protein
MNAVHLLERQLDADFLSEARLALALGHLTPQYR